MLAVVTGGKWLVLGAVSLRCAAASTCPVTLVKLPGEELKFEAGG